MTNQLAQNEAAQVERGSAVPNHTAAATAINVAPDTNSTLKTTFTFRRSAVRYLVFVAPVPE
jgi:hypothetical protein